MATDTTPQALNRDELCIEAFQSFLRIRSVSLTGNRDGSYTEAVNFLRVLCERAGLDTRILEPEPGFPIVLGTLRGSDPEVQSILLNGHYDVVPAVDKHWNFDPWAATLHSDGNIYGRGAQDMKSVCIQYLEALHRLKSSGKVFRRTIHVIFVPDEERGGEHGMKPFVKTFDFQKLNVGIALDEGLASPTSEYNVFYGERAKLILHLKATGPTGHGSRLIQDTAMEKLMNSINHFLDFRNYERDRLDGKIMGCNNMALSDVSTVNLTAIKGGVSVDGGKSFAVNVIPTEAEAFFDIRVATDVDLSVFEDECIKKWTQGEGVSYDLSRPCDQHAVSDFESKWGRVLQRALTASGIRFRPQIFAAATDSKYFRWLDIPAFGFSPMIHTPVLLHDHNEFLNEKVFLNGIHIYMGLISNLANSVLE
eukprot:345212_1